MITFDIQQPQLIIIHPHRFMAVRLIKVVLVEGAVIEVTVNVPRLDQVATVPDITFAVAIGPK